MPKQLYGKQTVLEINFLTKLSNVFPFYYLDRQSSHAILMTELAHIKHMFLNIVSIFGQFYGKVTRT